jgi:hypothetical protein
MSWLEGDHKVQRLSQKKRSTDAGRGGGDLADSLIADVGRVGLTERNVSFSIHS